MSSPVGPSTERWAGTFLIILSTSFYTMSNAVLRLLTDMKVDLDWFLFFKESIGLVLLLPWILFRLFQGRYRWVSKRLLFGVAIAAVICELIGARLHMVGFAVLGLVIAVPIVQSSTMLGTALLGQRFLGDKISHRRKTAMGILIVSVIVLSVGKEIAELTVEQSEKHSVTSVGVFLWGAAGTIVAGIAYSVYIVILRSIGRRFWKSDDSVWLSFQFSQWVGYDFPQDPPKRLYSPTPVTLMMSIVLVVGMIVFGSFLMLKKGVAGFTDTPPLAWKLILIPGVCNMIGFFFQVQGLRLTSAVQASLIAVSQIVVLSLIGIYFFGEQTNWLVWLGLTLTAYGVILSAKPES